MKYSETPFYYFDIGKKINLKTAFMSQEQAKTLHQEISSNNALGLLGIWIITTKQAYDGEFSKHQVGYIQFVDHSLMDDSEEALYGFFVRFNNGSGSTLSSDEFEVFNGF